MQGGFHDIHTIYTIGKVFVAYILYSLPMIFLHDRSLPIIVIHDRIFVAFLIQCQSSVIQSPVIQKVQDFGIPPGVQGIIKHCATQSNSRFVLPSHHDRPISL